MGFDGFSVVISSVAPPTCAAAKWRASMAPRSMLFSLFARDLVDSLELAHPLGITEESVIEGGLHSSFVKTGFGRHFEVEE